MAELVQLEVKKIDSKPVEWNFKKMKENALEIKSEYENLVVTEETLPECKKIKISLTKLRKELSDKRIEVKKELTKHVTVFENEVKEIDSLILSVESKIDSGVRFYEDKLEQEKQKEIDIILEEFKNKVSEKYQSLFEQGKDWLNKSRTMKSIRDNLEIQLMNIRKQIEDDKEKEQFVIEQCKTMSEIYGLLTPLTPEMFINSRESISELTTTIQKKAVEQKRVEDVAKNVKSDSVEEKPESVKSEFDDLVVRKDKIFYCFVSKDEYEMIKSFLNSKNIKYTIGD